MKKDFRNIVKNFPQLPGVYTYYDANGEVIYVGKAKNLRSRVGSYFQTNLDKHSKTYSLVQTINDVRYVVVDNEFDALILEAELIKKYKPKYNIVLKDDKSFLYIVIKKELFPSVVTSRKTNLDSHDINFGPFTSSSTTKQIVRIVRKIFPFRDCPPSKFKKHEKLLSPCLYGHLGLCPSPCVKKEQQDIKAYKSHISRIRKLLSGDSSVVLKGLESEMKKSSKNKEYERAAYYRDLVNKFSYITSNYRNAEEYIDNPHLMEDLHRKALENLNEVLPGLSRPPQRIECYDVANISGKDAVGSMVVATGGAIDKSEYRRFKIRFKDTPDDVDMIYDVLTRRFNRNWEHPDLIIVDGGKPQVSAAERAVEDLNLNIPVIGLAKKFETVIFREKGEFRELSLALDSHGLKLLIRLRDEAHRFAQSYHHLLRLKSLEV